MKKTFLGVLVGMILMQTALNAAKTDDPAAAGLDGAGKLDPQSVSSYDPGKNYYEQGIIDARYVISQVFLEEFVKAARHARNMIGEMDKLNRTAPVNIVADYRNGIRSVSKNLWCMVTREPFKGLELKQPQQGETDLDVIERLGYNDALMAAHAVLQGNETLAFKRGFTLSYYLTGYGILMLKSKYYAYSRGMRDGLSKSFDLK